MSSVSARIPKSLEDELDRFVDEEKLDRSTAVRKLLSEGIDDWKKSRAVEKLKDGEVSFSRAAEIADMDVWSFSALLEEEKVTWIKDDKAREDLEDL